MTCTNFPLKQHAIRHHSIYINPSEVVLLEAVGNYTIVYLNNNKKIVFSKTLKVYEEVFSSAGFIRIHRNAVVNPHYIKAFNKLESSFILTNMTEVTVSRRRLRELRFFLKESNIRIVEQLSIKIKKVGRSPLLNSSSFKSLNS